VVQNERTAAGGPGHAAATRNSPPGRTAGRAGRVARERRGPDHEGTTPGPAGNPGV